MKFAFLALGATLFAPAVDPAEAIGSGTGGKTHPHDGLPEGSLVDTEIRVNGVSGIKFRVPATVEAFDTLAKRNGAALDAAVKQQLFHGSYGDIRAGITAKLVEQGVGKPKMSIGKFEVVEVFETKDDKSELVGYSTVDGKKSFKLDQEVKIEPDKAFFDRVCAEQGVEPSHYADLIQQVANENPFDPSRKQRAAGARKIAKTYIEAAQGIVDAGELAINGATAQLSELLDRPIDVSDPETRVMVIATAIADNELREKRERDEKLKNKYMAFAG
jgi:hypothetical protein